MADQSSKKYIDGIAVPVTSDRECSIDTLELREGFHDGFLDGGEAVLLNLAQDVVLFATPADVGSGSGCSQLLSFDVDVKVLRTCVQTVQ